MVWHCSKRHRLDEEEPVTFAPSLFPFPRLRRRLPQVLCGLGLSLLVTSTACSLQPKSPPIATQMTMASFAVDTHLGKKSAEEALQKGPLVVLFYRGHW